MIDFSVSKMAKYYKTRESVKEYIQAAKDFDGSYLIKELKKILVDGSKLLELGSGPGTDWQILCKSYETTGSDNSTEFLDHLLTTHPDGYFLDIEAVSIETDKRFDGIYSNKVLHHLKDTELTLSA